MWRHLYLTVLQAEFRTDRSCELPEYLGSTLRGALGQELRAVSCVEPGSPCAVCRHPDRCASGALFDDPAMSLPLDGGGSRAAAGGVGALPPSPWMGEGRGGGDGKNPPSGTSCLLPPQGGKGAAPPSALRASPPRGGRESPPGGKEAAPGFDRPRPYVLVPPPWRRGVYAPGEMIRLGVTLVGRGRVWFPWVVAAMAGVGRRGLGVERHSWSLVRLGAVGPDGGLVEFDPERRGVGAVVPELEAARIVADGPPPGTQAVVALVTPADLKQKGRRLDRLDGPTFFRRLIRRVGTLVETYGNPPDDAREFDYHALAGLADQVVVADQQVSVQVWDRFSSRREAKHPLSGLVGQALLTSIPEPLWPYLILGQWVHLGKGASFGQGRYVVWAGAPQYYPGKEEDHLPARSARE